MTSHNDTTFIIVTAIIPPLHPMSRTTPHATLPITP